MSTAHGHLEQTHTCNTGPHRGLYRRQKLHSCRRLAKRLSERTSGRTCTAALYAGHHHPRTSLRGPSQNGHQVWNSASPFDSCQTGSVRWMNLLSPAAGYVRRRLVPLAHPPASSDAQTVCLQGSRSFPADSTSSLIFPFTLQQLIVLRTLALSQSLEEAAAAVAMSESNIRATLGKLEKDLDVELLQAQVTLPYLTLWSLHMADHHAPRSWLQ